jgi:prepilin-type N-terminal cleavage/methylation domain-containing protein/prepilin-type processing-associated H-X9-DG protein
MRRQRGFTLIELLVVIGIVGALIGILVPVVSSARTAAKATACASNLRQLATALLNYAADNRGAFPGNKGADHVFWYNQAVLGRYAGGAQKLADGTLGGGVFTCPNDAGGAVRSYAMNVWASSLVSKTVDDSQADQPPKGKLFDSGTKGGERLILLIEALWEDPSENTLALNASPAVVGWVARPGERFGPGENGPEFVTLRYGPIASQLDYSRHRSWGQRNLRPAVAKGSLNIAFADGHVKRYCETELADATTKKSTYEALWSPADRDAE